MGNPERGKTTLPTSLSWTVLSFIFIIKRQIAVLSLIEKGSSIYTAELLANATDVIQNNFSK